MRTFPYMEITCDKCGKGGEIPLNLTPDLDAQVSWFLVQIGWKVTPKGDFCNDCLNEQTSDPSASEGGPATDAGSHSDDTAGQVSRPRIPGGPTAVDHPPRFLGSEPDYGLPWYGKDKLRTED